MVFIKYIKNNYSIISILIISLSIFYNILGKDWKYEDNLINRDVKSYYAYLPAAIIYKDLSFEFVYANKNTKFLRNNIWVKQLKNGKKVVKTTMGMSFIYLPAFVTAHIFAKSLGYKPNGFSPPYKVALNILALIYLLIGLIYLRKILLILKHRELIIFITITAIGIGTNLLFYSSIEPTMSHLYNFTLITIFIYNTIKWHENKNIKHIIYLGLIGGLITLIRPTNIFIYVLFVFWNINSISELKNRFISFITNIKIYLFLILLFIIPWIPQLIFWKIQTGDFLFFSYGNNEKFFFNNPQIFNILFSYWKGWYIYTPIMLIATVGLVFLHKTQKGLSVLIGIYLTIMIYILSSWWSWWFGGGFGNRAFVDFYGIMAIPFASVTAYILNKKHLKIIYGLIITALIYLNIFQTKQYINGAIHYWSITKELYWEQFLKPRRTVNFYNMLKIPDDSLAHLGIYKLISIKQTNSSPESLMSKKDDRYLIFNYDLRANTEKTVILNKSDYINYCFNTIYSNLDNNKIKIKLFDLHNIQPKQYNNLLYCKAEPFIENDIKEINVNFNIFDIKHKPSGCILVLSVEKDGKTKFRKERIISSDEEISETIVLPNNILKTDIVKIYVWQNTENKIVFRISKLRLNVE